VLAASGAKTRYFVCFPILSPLRVPSAGRRFVLPFFALAMRLLLALKALREKEKEQSETTSFITCVDLLLA
jgi:hypothetical protein